MSAHSHYLTIALRTDFNSALSYCKQPATKNTTHHNTPQQTKRNKEKQREANKRTRLTKSGAGSAHF
eukprot:4118276-Amphidinium_carterae.1